MTDEILQISSLFSHLRELLLSNRGTNHLPGVEAAINVLAQSSRSTEERKEIVRSSFKSMMGGAGTLGDFVIEGKNPKSHQLLNTELTAILDAIWDKLDC